MEIGIVRLGQMGSAIASNLLRTGQRLTMWIEDKGERVFIVGAAPEAYLAGDSGLFLSGIGPGAVNIRCDTGTVTPRGE